MPEGDDLTVLDESKDGWAKVSVDEGKGYVSTDYVTLSTEYTYAESAAEEKGKITEGKKRSVRLRTEQRRKQRVHLRQPLQVLHSHKAQILPYRIHQAHLQQDQRLQVMQDKFVGNPYVYGGTSLTNGTDCSGFVMSVYAHFGVSLPHSSSALRSVGYGVSTSNMQPGDIVCYSGHVAILCWKQYDCTCKQCKRRY